MKVESIKRVLETLSIESQNQHISIGLKHKVNEYKNPITFTVNNTTNFVIVEGDMLTIKEDDTLYYFDIEDINFVVLNK